MVYRFIARLGWIAVLLLCVIPIALWTFQQPLSERFATTYIALGSIGKLAGILAIVLFCINVILTTRLKPIELLFGGLNKMYIAHHLTGGIALCIILIHPLAFSFQKVTYSLHTAATFLLPNIQDIPTALGILGLWLFIALMVITFFFSLPYKVWLLTHKFLGVVLLLIGLHVILISSDTTNNPLLKGFLLVLLGAAGISFIYRTLLPRILVRRYKYVITKVTQPASAVVRIYMEPRNKQTSFKSGQFIFVSFLGEGFSHEWHPFSISSNSTDSQISITVKSLGKYTDTLVKLAPGMIGMEVGVEGAYGRFSFRNFKAKRQIWVAGGIGITPFLGMIKDISQDYKVDLYYSVKTDAEMIDGQEIQQLAAVNSNSFRFIPFVTDKSGFLTAKTIQQSSSDLKEAEILLCGPPPMMHALRDQFKEIGVKNWAVHSEEFAMS